MWTTWLLEENTLSAIADAMKSGFQPDAVQQAAHVEALSRGAERIYSRAAGTARITVNGVLTPAPSFMALLFGGGNTTYSELIEAIRAADSDPEVREIEYVISSPGGTVDGLFDAVAAMQGLRGRKRQRAIVSNMAASAAYGLATQADEIVATNRAARVGSVGTAITMMTRDDQVTITSSEAPRKRPDVRTEEGREMVREELDAMHELFADAIASGRGTTVARVNTDFGRGGMVLADDAVKRGMIDRVGSHLPTTTQRQTASGGKQLEANSKMDIEALKAQHPDVYAAAVKEGVDKERDRVAAHLTMGNAYGAMDTALKAVEEGAEMTNLYTAKYLAAGANKTDVNARQAESDEAEGAAKTGAKGLANGTDEIGAKVASIVESQFGLGSV